MLHILFVLSITKLSSMPAFNDSHYIFHFFQIKNGGTQFSVHERKHNATERL